LDNLAQAALLIEPHSLYSEVQDAEVVNLYSSLVLMSEGFGLSAIS
jgi:hypothetical protein